MEFSAILSAVYDECNYGSSPAAGVVTRVKRLVNEGVRAILSEPGLGRLIDSDSPYTFATTASTARYVVPEAVARIKGIRETTNDIALQAMDLQRYRHADPDPASSSGTPTHYVPIGRVTVATQPSDASAIYAKSTSAADTSQVVRVESTITGGYTKLAANTLNGTTAVQITDVDTIEITDFYVSAVGAGTITLHEDSGSGTELARITIGAKRPRYYGFYLWPTPAAAVTYSVDYRREVQELVQDADEPPLPTDVHPMLVAYAVMREKEKTGDTDGLSIAQARYARLLAKLKYQTQTLSDEIPVLGRGARVGRSRLGAWFSADSWS